MSSFKAVVLRDDGFADIYMPDEPSRPSGQLQDILIRPVRSKDDPPPEKPIDKGRSTPTDPGGPPIDGDITAVEEVLKGNDGPGLGDDMGTYMRKRREPRFFTWVDENIPGLGAPFCVDALDLFISVPKYEIVSVSEIGEIVGQPRWWFRRNPDFKKRYGTCGNKSDCDFKKSRNRFIDAPQWVQKIQAAMER